MFRFNQHRQGAYYLSLLKLELLKNQLKYIGVVGSVVWLHMQPHHRIAQIIRSLMLVIEPKYVGAVLM